MSKKGEQIQKTVRVVSTAHVASVLGPQNQRLMPTITNAISGATNISAGFLVMPPARVAKPHYHKHNELIIFFLEGWGVAFIGPNYEPHFVGPGDFLYIPEGVVHFGVNLSETDRHVGIEIRTDPHFNEDVVLVPEMNAKAEALAAEYRRKFANGQLKVPSSWADQHIGPYKFVDFEGTPAPTVA